MAMFNAYNPAGATGGTGAKPAVRGNTTGMRSLGDLLRYRQPMTGGFQTPQRQLGNDMVYPGAGFQNPARARLNSRGAMPGRVTPRFGMDYGRSRMTPGRGNAAYARPNGVQIYNTGIGDTSPSVSPIQFRQGPMQQGGFNTGFQSPFQMPGRSMDLPISNLLRMGYGQNFRI